MGDIIKRYRLAAGLSQAELARLVDVKQQTVSKWEKGGAIDTANLLSVIALLRIPGEEIFPEINGEPQQLYIGFDSEGAKLMTDSSTLTRMSVEEWAEYIINLVGPKQAEAMAKQLQQGLVALDSDFALAAGTAQPTPKGRKRSRPSPEPNE